MTIFGYRPGQIRKAIAAGLAPAVPLLAVAVVDLHVSRGEAGGLLGAMVTGFAVVFGIKANDPAPEQDVVEP